MNKWNEGLIYNDRLWRILTAVLIVLLLGAMIGEVLSQGMDDPRWYDGDTANDPNYCFTDWDCNTESDWARGWHQLRCDAGFPCLYKTVTDTAAPMSVSRRVVPRPMSMPAHTVTVRPFRACQ